MSERNVGTRVTATDMTTGESSTVEIFNDYVVIADGDRYIDGIQVWPKTGTAVITVKRGKPTPGRVEAEEAREGMGD